MVIYSTEGEALAMRMNKELNIIQLQHGTIYINHNLIEMYDTQERALYECVDIIDAYINNENIYQFANKLDFPHYDIENLDENKLIKRILSRKRENIRLTVDVFENEIVIFLGKNN